MAESGISRRDFLKLGAAGIAAVLVGKGVYDVGKELQKPTAHFSEVEAGDSILLRKDGVSQQISIQYEPNTYNLSHLKLRTFDGKVTNVPFQDGQTIERGLGEILDPSVVPLKLNTDLLAPDTTVHYVYTTGPVGGTDPNVRKLLEPHQYDGLFGIKVVTNCTDAIVNGANPPKEINTRPLHAVDPAVGEGWALGHFQPDGVLKIFGFIQDARVFMPKA
ncbi:MAG: twin-arginine translocation signal domain-containing protein [Candidatus Gottesmanbacteria bacterium]|nr:twin-arginine translocation signal domain-containing protein [Candidatus Gottesmanbacteria bacterium]